MSGVTDEKNRVNFVKLFQRTVVLLSFLANV